MLKRRRCEREKNTENTVWEERNQRVTMKNEEEKKEESSVKDAGRQANSVYNN